MWAGICPHHSGCIRVRLFWVITNTHRGVLQWARDLTGVGLVVQKRDQARRRRCWRHVIGDLPGIEKALRLMLPYLRIKKKQTQLMLQFLKSRRTRPPRSPFSDAELRLLFGLRVENEKKDSKTIRYKGQRLTLPQFLKLARPIKKTRSYEVIVWTKKMDAMLGKDVDKRVARKLKLKLAQVQRRRSILEIAPWRKNAA